VWNNSFPGVDDCAGTISGTTGSGIYVGPNSFAFYDGNNSVASSNALAVTNWYAVVVSKSQGTNYQLYVNGLPDSSGVLANVNMDAYGVTVGNRGGSFEGMNGAIADWRMFGRVLSTNEVYTLALNGPDDVALTLPHGSGQPQPAGPQTVRLRIH
jgi:hypothetical protein